MDSVYSLFNVSHQSAKLILVDVQYGAGYRSICVCNQSEYLQQTQAKNTSFSCIKVRHLTLNLSQGKLPVLEKINVDVHCNNQTVMLLLLVVVKGGSPSLLG